MIFSLVLSVFLVGAEENVRYFLEGDETDEVTRGGGVNLFPFCYKLHSNYIGNTIKTIDGMSTMDSCAAACKTYPNRKCKYAKFNTYTNQCKLQDAHSETLGNFYMISVSLNCGRCFALNQEYPDPINSDLGGSESNCRETCQDSTPCRFYSYNENTKNCRHHKTVDYYNPILRPGAVTQTQGCDQIIPPPSSFTQIMSADERTDAQLDFGDGDGKENAGEERMTLMYVIIIAIVLIFAIMAIYACCVNNECKGVCCQQ